VNTSIDSKTKEKQKFSGILILLLTTGVIAAVITSIFNLCVSLQTNKTLENIESIKFEHTLTVFRYEKLINTWEQLIEIKQSCSLDVLAELENPIEVSSETVNNIIKTLNNTLILYNKSAPLFDKDLRKVINDSANEFTNIMIAHSPQILFLSSQSETISSIPKKNVNDLKKISESFPKFMDIFTKKLFEQLKRLLIQDN